IKRAADRAAHLTRQLLAFGRRQMLQPRTVHLNDVVRRNETFLGRVLGEAITLRLILCSEPLWIEVDTAQIEQVLLNLATNARDAIDGAGVLQIATKPRVLARGWAQERGLAGGRVAEIAVRDTGRGMDPETLQRIFEPFFTTKEVGKGTGLGLSTCHAIVRSHGGFIHLYSESGRGTRFKIYLPADVHAAVAVEARMETSRPPRGQGELILVVEDEASIRTITARTLERSGYTVLLACHGREAVSLYAAHANRIALTLTDMSMPIMDGPTTISAIRAIDPKARIVGSSGMDSDEQALGAGVHDFVSKPYTAANLLRVIRTVIDARE
ncbi:MAG: response regulator, partial [Deltaproteobacteria bacterium]|nr:response regulator [Deltaproteobacteria bacterium]